MKKRSTVILSMMLVLVLLTGSAELTLTSEERANLFATVITEIENYLIAASNDSRELYAIAATLEQLDSFSQSKFLRMYILILAKINDGEFDNQMDMYLSVISFNPEFEKFLSDTGSIGTVAQLQHYKQAREYERDGKINEAAAAYQDCISFYDAAERYIHLSENLKQSQYDLAMRKLNDNDYAGAYFIFVSLEKFQDSEQIAASIVQRLGYTPQDETDNLKPITGLKASAQTENSITLQWDPSAHAERYLVYYKETGSATWLVAGRTSTTSFEMNELRNGTSYDFMVIAAIDMVQTIGIQITSETISAVTATPSPTIYYTPTPSPIPTPVQTPAPSYLTFGHYEQNGNNSDGKEPIEWLVLDVQGSKALLISRYALDVLRYNRSAQNVTWEKCAMHSWLNREFMKAAFSAAEQKAILTTAVDNGKSQGSSEYTTTGGKDTSDKIFLLSYAEAMSYFANNEARVCYPTPYAIKRGAKVNKESTIWWWLRSPANTLKRVMRVTHGGGFGSINVNDKEGCVRPALWIDLDKVK